MNTVIDCLDFKNAKCRDCYKCLRECPVKAIRFENHQAKIIREKCILCGHCTLVCPQNAKQVHTEIDRVKDLLGSGARVIASVAPSFIGNFEVKNFASFRDALIRAGFSDAEETAVGARWVSDEYVRLLKTGKYKNFITSACPAIDRMLQLYYPDALKYLAPVVSPMVAHARMLAAKYENAFFVFIGPCIAKKREAAESGVVDAVITFEEAKELLDEKEIAFNEISEPAVSDANGLARFYPVNMGIIKSMTELPDGYEYVAVDGVRRSFDIFKDIDSLSGMFIEVNCCEHSCVNGPCSLPREGGSLKANEKVRKFAAKGEKGSVEEKPAPKLACEYKRVDSGMRTPSEREITAILAKTGKTTAADELNCGACGYNSCREKAIAVYNGYADVEMCIPYMRGRAEIVSHEIIMNNPVGIVVIDGDYKITEINKSAAAILGADVNMSVGQVAFDCFNSEDFIAALAEGKNVVRKRIFVNKTKKYAELTIIVMAEHKLTCGILRDVTDKVAYDKRLAAVKEETLKTTDDVVKKQMRVAQEIASLLGETTAETKVALLKLKEILKEEDDV